MNPDPVISVRGLRKSYGAFEAVKGVDFEVGAGEIFGLLGPNAAGKTTTVETWKASGELLVFHGPSLHRELQRRVEAGIPAAVALRAGTSNAAKVLGRQDRTGLIREGYDADLLIVVGNPLQNISDTERITGVLFKGERIGRAGLFEQEWPALVP